MDDRWEILKPVERQVAWLISKGMSDIAIAERMGIPENSAKHYARFVRTALGCKTRTEVALWVHLHIT